jgi:UDP-N-acetyl-D-galactosamine dehydrogenase
VPDLRNSRVIDVIRRLQQHGHQIVVHDPLADAGEAQHEYGIGLDGEALAGKYDMVVVAVPHEAYDALSDDQLSGMLAAGGLLADLKNLYASRPLVGVNRWTL